MAFAIQQFGMSERQACKLVNLDRSSYRYEPMPDHNAQLREELVNLARQKPRYGYRRLHALLVRRGQTVVRNASIACTNARVSCSAAEEKASEPAGSPVTSPASSQPGMGTGLCF